METMQVSIRRIGNSQGIILPRNLLQQTGIEHEVDLHVVDGAIVLRPAVSNPRAGWDAQFKKALEEGHMPEDDSFDSMANEFDQNEWQW